MLENFHLSIHVYHKATDVNSQIIFIANSNIILYLYLNIDRCLEK